MNATTRAEEIISDLRSKADPAGVAGMVRYGINPAAALGIKIPVLREIARAHRRDHDLALALWASGIHEARILATMVDDWRAATEAQMEAWVAQFNSWDLCDQTIINLFEDTPMAWTKAIEWCRREPEFERRAGFVMMARLAVSDKKAPDSDFEQFFPELIRGAADERNYVKKAVNWAVRQIGKRSARLNARSISAAEDIAALESKAGRWIAADALRELRGDAVRKRLGLKP